MITFRITTRVEDDRQVVLTLPAEVPTGQAELVVSVQASEGETMPSDAAEWLEVQKPGGRSDQLRYPLRGSVISYEQPTEPVAQEDWEAAR